MKKFTFISFLISLCFNCIAFDSLAKTNFKIDASKANCEAIKFKDPTYMDSVQKLMLLNLTKDWLKNLNENNLALNSIFDKTTYQKKKCYWIINFYESNTQKLNLWKTFVVEINGNYIYELDAVNPNIKILISNKNNEVPR